jgi:hypothetical protein
VCGELLICVEKSVIRHTQVLDDPTLTRTFENEATINEFWHQSDGERVKRWGERLDLEGVDIT